MAYTAVDFKPMPDSQLVAIYQVPAGSRVFVAETVLGVAIYRNPDDRGCENVLVPMHAQDFTTLQSHYFSNRRLLNERLPCSLILDPQLFDAVSQYAVENSGSPAHLMPVDGSWVVIE